MILKGFEEERDHIGSKEENNYMRRNKGKNCGRNDRRHRFASEHLDHHPLALFSFSPLKTVAKTAVIAKSTPKEL